MVKLLLMPESRLGSQQKMEAAGAYCQSDQIVH